jgi:hypothetical protein
MKKAHTRLYGFTIDGYDVDRFTTYLETFLTVFNSSESLSQYSIAGTDTYMFLTKRERNKQADVLEKVMAMKALADAKELIENEREWMDEVRV